MPTILPAYARKSSIRADGSREKVRVADVKGRFQKGKTWAYNFLLLLFAILPFISIQGQRLILLDIQRRHFYLFGLSFNAQDIYLIFFLVSGLAFTLFFVTAIWGRVWCGWSCPQTVLMDGFFRKIERWVEGNRNEQVRLSQSSWTAKKISLFSIKHAIFLLASLLISLIFIAYFVPIPSIFDLLKLGPSSHPVLSLWLCGVTALIYLDFSWFREQVCVIVCPYGRFQSLLTDDDTLVIGYDEKRGEPRGKKTDPNTGDCIDCDRCVVVCPTGIDIRNGLQLDCIGCANCIDACDEVMEKIGKPKGLVRYDSLNGLAGKAKKFLRPRVIAYSALFLIGVLMFAGFLRKHTPFEANVLRLVGPPYVLTEGKIRNQFEIHLFNKMSDQMTLLIEPKATQGESITLPVREVTLKRLEDRRIPLFVEVPEKTFQTSFPMSIQVKEEETGKIVQSTFRFLGPK